MVPALALICVSYKKYTYFSVTGPDEILCSGPKNEKLIIFI